MAKLEVPFTRGLRMKRMLAVCTGIERVAEVPVARSLRMKGILAVCIGIERMTERMGRWLAELEA